MITPLVGHFVTVNGRGSITYNVIVVASNDNESSQVTLSRFSICVPVPVIRGLTRFSQWLRLLRLKTAWSSLTL